MIHVSPRVLILLHNLIAIKRLHLDAQQFFLTRKKIHAISVFQAPYEWLPKLFTVIYRSVVEHQHQLSYLTAVDEISSDGHVRQHIQRRKDDRDLIQREIKDQRLIKL